MNFTAEKTAFIFPGQGSQEVGMGYQLSQAYPVARATFAQADALLGYELSSVAWDGPEAQLNDTYYTQPALFVHSIAALRVFQEKYPGFQPAFVAGHSMGELTALEVSGACSFVDCLQLVQTRAALMKQAGEQDPGGMAAILGLDVPTVESLCLQASEEGEIVQVANDNCPGQVVVSGSGIALRNLIPLAEGAGARKVVPLAVSIAAHSPKMEHAQAEFNAAVDGTPLSEPRMPIIGNVSAEPMYRVRDLEDDLKAQLTSRVRWTETIEYLVSQGVDTFLEIGSGDVLSKLVRRIDRNSTRIALGTPEDFSKLDD